MSYILDALRKADAERERGSVPSLHAQPMIGGSASPAAARAAGTPPWPWIGIGLGALALVLVLGWLLWRGGSSTMPASQPTPVAAVAPPAPPPPTPVAAAAPKDEALPVIRQTRPATPVPAVPSAAALARPDAKPAAAAASASGETRIYALAELPDEIRRQLPALSVGGSAYSKKAADRILIVNGQVLHEGDKVAPELVLQQIKLRAAVLAFKGYRYEIAY
jgi:general secretion pathway protein B